MISDVPIKLTHQQESCVLRRVSVTAVSLTSPGSKPASAPTPRRSNRRNVTIVQHSGNT